MEPLAILASAREGDDVVFSGGSYTSPWQPTGISATAAGNVVGQLLSDTVDHTYAVFAGLNPYRFRKITQTGTTATGLVVVRGGQG